MKELIDDIDVLSPEERVMKVSGILAKGALRIVEKRRTETLEDRAFGESLAAEVAALPGGLA